MPLTRTQKEEIFDTLKKEFAENILIVFTNYRGLTVNEISLLRKSLKEVHASYRVVKKTLILLVCKELKIDVSPESLDGQIGLVLSRDDEVLPTKNLYSFSKTNTSLQILGGILEQKAVTKDAIIQLAKLPTQEELLARLVGSVSNPLYGLRNVLIGNITSFVYQLSALSQK